MEPLFDITEPNASALIESLRGFGYTVQTAIADLIDNCITAEANNIWVDFVWNGQDSYVTIRDDGIGMSENELVNAMRPGSQSPLQQRSASDLGRFGLGLKTASFSQCRRLVVRSRKEKLNQSTRCWDLDYILQTGQWRLLRSISSETEKRLSTFTDTICGTIVLWEILDRIVGEGGEVGGKAHSRFLQIIADVEQHIGITFHRFISQPRRLQIFINGRQIDPWDPFLSQEPSTQQLGEETLLFRGETIVVRPFILPHHSKISQETHKAAAGLKGWNAHQGFYIYRNKRLLIAGDWLGLPILKEEHYKLARIQVDIPNSIDSYWQIDVRKSKASPPPSLKDDFKRIAAMTRDRAVRIYRFRGKVLAQSKSVGLIFPWHRTVKHGKIFYKINQAHPLANELLKLPQPFLKMFRSFIHLIEETVPVPLIAIDHTEQAQHQSRPFELTPPSEIRAILQNVYLALRREGIGDKAARERILNMEPFQHYPELVASLEIEAIMEDNQ